MKAEVPAPEGQAQATASGAGKRQVPQSRAGGGGAWGHGLCRGGGHTQPLRAGELGEF